jgi:hypothetical protein
MRLGPPGSDSPDLGNVHYFAYHSTSSPEGNCGRDTGKTRAEKARCTFMCIQPQYNKDEVGVFDILKSG